MKVVIAPDSFKESVSAERVAAAIERGFREIYPDAEYIKLPIADGGEGTVDALVAATGGHKVYAQVTGPMGTPVEACYGVLGDGGTAVIEMAAASGLMLVPPEQRDPLLATSYGTGELILQALDTGVHHIILGIGGSATSDAGVGMMQALGVSFHHQQPRELAWGAGELSEISAIRFEGLDPRLQHCKIDIACDVDNPLIGPRGAAAVFAPQKGATPEMVTQLEYGLTHYAKMIQQLTGVDISQMAGGGAAGGMGATAAILLNGELKPGIEIVMEALHFEDAVATADLVVTGEGRIDSQTAGGKAPMGVAKLAKRYNLPVIALAGVLGEGVEVVHQHGIDAVFSILPRLAPLGQVLSQGEVNLQQCARNVACAIKIGQQVK